MKNIGSDKMVALLREVPNFYDVEQVLRDAGIDTRNHTDTQIIITCPYHEDKRPSFRIGTRTGIWHCFSCGRSGTLLKLMHQLSGSSLTFPGYADSLLKSNKNLQKELGFTTIFTDEKTLAPEFQQRRRFNASMIPADIPLSTLSNHVRKCDDSFEALSITLTLLQSGVGSSDVKALFDTQHQYDRVQTEEVVDIAELLKV